MFFAPIGLVVDFTRVAPELLGEPIAAFQHACRSGHRQVEHRIQQAYRTLEGLGLPWPLTSPSLTPVTALTPPAGGPGGAAPEPAPQPSEPRRREPVEADPSVGGADLAIPDYESLSASQVMPRLESLKPDELEAIRTFEHQHRGRKTILNKIAQIQGA